MARPKTMGRPIMVRLPLNSEAEFLAHAESRGLKPSELARKILLAGIGVK